MTIKDIARYAGVSISTVSRVLNNLDRVSPQTRKRVLEAIDEFGYVQNNFAAFMVTGQTKLILIVVPDFINEFFGAVVQGAERCLREYSYSTIVISTGDNESSDISSRLSNLEYAVDGAIIIPTGGNAEHYSSFHKPHVFVDRSVSDSTSDSVLVDNFGGMYLLTNELINAGHHKISIITGNERLNIGRDRLSGFRKAMQDRNLPINERYICKGELCEENGYHMMIELFSGTEPPTAVIAGNNLICSGIIAAIQKLDLTIGRDLSLVSFDDQPLASLLQPGITVIDRPTTEMGMIAAQLLLERLQKKDNIGQRKIVMPVTLIRRNSIQSPPKQ